jgi:hypothetical protein
MQAAAAAADAVRERDLSARNDRVPHGAHRQKSAVRRERESRERQCRELLESSRASERGEREGGREPEAACGSQGRCGAAGGGAGAGGETGSLIVIIALIKSQRQLPGPTLFGLLSCPFG